MPTPQQEPPAARSKTSCRSSVLASEDFRPYCRPLQPPTVEAGSTKGTLMTTSQLFDRSRLEIVSHDECLRLLRSVPVGRLVYTRGGLPAVRLVNYLLD